MNNAAAYAIRSSLVLGIFPGLRYVSNAGFIIRNKKMLGNYNRVNGKDHLRLRVKSSCLRKGRIVLSCLVELSHRLTNWVFKLTMNCELYWPVFIFISPDWFFFASEKEFSVVLFSINTFALLLPTSENNFKIRPNQDLVVHICLFLPSLLSLSLRD